MQVADRNTAKEKKMRLHQVIAIVAWAMAAFGSPAIAADNELIPDDDAMPVQRGQGWAGPGSPGSVNVAPLFGRIKAQLALAGPGGCTIRFKGRGRQIQSVGGSGFRCNASIGPSPFSL
ncbi:hypothetical protein VTK56DRAFT_1759 [Thermocarpiscus australiensis]